MKLFRKAKELATLVFRDFERKHLEVVAAGAAYFFMISLVPALVLLAAAAAFLPLQGGTHGAKAFISHVVPPQGLSLMEKGLSAITPHRTGLLWFGFIAMLWLCSKGMKGVIAGLDIVHNVREPRRLWTNRILAFGLTFAVGVMLLLGVLLTLLGPVLEKQLAVYLPAQSLWTRLWPYLQWSLSAIFVFAAIALLYLVAPNVSRAGRLTLPGAAIAAAAWLSLAWGLGFYFHHIGGDTVDTVSGVLAAPVAIMVWLYWGANVILLGAEINVNLQTQRDRSVEAPIETLPRWTDVA